VWELDLESRVVHLSAGAARLSGFPPAPRSVDPDELAGFIHPDGVDAVDRDGRAIAKVIGARSPVPLAFVAMAPLRHTRLDLPGDVHIAAYLDQAAQPLVAAERDRHRVGEPRGVAGAAARAARAHRRRQLSEPEGSGAAAEEARGAHGSGENGSVALEHLMARPYDLVLMDCHMPEMNGYQAAAEVRRREGPNQHVPIVAVTADVASGSRERALA